MTHPTDVARHSEYPHLFGALFDCPACEARCYCRPGETECVHCAIVAESNAYNSRTLAYGGYGAWSPNGHSY